MMATYRSDGADCKGVGAVCWQATGLTVDSTVWGRLERVWAVCWQPTSLMGHVGAGLGCMLATYRSNGSRWSRFGVVCWQHTGLTGHVGAGLGLYVGNLQVWWGVLERVWGGMLATYYRSYGHVGAGVGLYVGNLQEKYIYIYQEDYSGDLDIKKYQ